MRRSALRNPLTLAVTLLAAATIIALGPRARLADFPRVVDLPDDLADFDAYLQDAERPFSDIVPGAEKRIAWASGARAPTRLAIVYLHGFSATHRDTAPLAERIAARLGANLYLARLTGHGRGSAPLGEAQAADWLNDAREAWQFGRRIGERVILMGHSTGATLALWLAHEAADDSLGALVLLSPNFGPADPAANVLLWPWGGAIAHAIEGPTRDWQPANEMHARYFTTSYPTRVLLPMMALVHATRRLSLEDTRAATIIAYCPDDTVVDAEAIEKAFERFPDPKRLMPIQPSGDPEHHVVAGDILSPETTDPLAAEIVAFLRENAL